MGLFLAIGAVNKDIKTKENFAKYHIHNILAPFDVSPQVKRCLTFNYKHDI